jgi:hypothetical protein
LFILLPGFIRRVELKPIANKKLSTYSSPRHIAKQLCKSGNLRVLKIEKDEYSNYRHT